MLAVRDDVSPESRTALIVLGSVCLGAWVALLASAGHDGRDG
jgi:hypothetical protein